MLLSSSSVLISDNKYYLELIYLLQSRSVSFLTNAWHVILSYNWTMYCNTSGRWKKHHTIVWIYIYFVIIKVWQQSVYREFVHFYILHERVKFENCVHFFAITLPYLFLYSFTITQYTIDLCDKTKVIYNIN